MTQQQDSVAGQGQSMRFCAWIATRYLWSSRTDAAITVITLIAILGVAIGVITLNMVMGVMTGFQNELKRKILGADAHITVRHLVGEIADWESLVPTVEGVQGVASVSPYSYNQALLQTKAGASGVLIRGIQDGTASARQLKSYLSATPGDESLFSAREYERIDPVSGETRVSKLPSIVIGLELAKNYNIEPGDVVTLLSPETTSTPFGLSPRFKRFVVGAVYSSGLVEYESSLVYVALDVAQQFFRLKNRITAFEIRVDDVDKAPLIAKNIRDVVGAERHGLYTRDWTEVNEAFFEAFKLEKRVYFIVLLLIIVMASFSIVSSLIMVVIEKRKDIAILKTLGANRRSIGYVFNLQGAVIGIIGVGSGTVGGLLGCVLLDAYGFPIDQRIFQMATLPVEIVPLNFILVAVCAFAICCVATMYPSRRASMLHPSDILRYE